MIAFTVVLTVFVTSLLTGGPGVFLGARLIVGSNDHVHAIVTDRSVLSFGSSARSCSDGFRW